MEKVNQKGVSDRVALSLNEANLLMDRAFESQKSIAEMEQVKVDRIVEAMAEAGYRNAWRLADLAVEETGMGRVEDKTIKNQFATKNLYEYIRNMRTTGIIKEDKLRGVVEIATPMGVVVGLTPTTNPTSTVLFKAIIAMKSRNAIVLSPHPRAVKCSLEAARIMEEAAVSAGAPRGLINCMSNVSLEATNELLHHPKTSVVLATGGSNMVKAAYSSGNPAYGVGPGNVPVFIERTADIEDAVSKIMLSKTFDNGTVCASEEAIVTETIISQSVIQELENQGGYFVKGSDIAALTKTAVKENGALHPQIVGKSPKIIADLAGIDIPEGTKLLIVPLEGVGKDFPLSAEKLCPIIGLYIEKDWKDACFRCIELINYGGLGHSMVMHSKNEEVIMEFAIKKPVSRILVNTPSTHGAIGYTTGLAPSMTLGSGTIGGSITSDNVTPMHLINIRRLAYHTMGREPKADGRTRGLFFTKAEITEAVQGIMEQRNRQKAADYR